MTSVGSFLSIHHRLLELHSRQNWWPADSPFEIMIGAILTQNTAWTNVEKAINNLKHAQALSADAILAAPLTELAGWIRPSGYYNQKAKRLQGFCCWLRESGGLSTLSQMKTVRLRTELLSVCGIGPETADDILLYAFERPVFVIDAYTRRIFSRLGLISGDEKYEVLRLKLETELDGDVELYNEYHALIVSHGKDVCRKTPACDRCNLTELCEYPRLQ